MATGDPEPPKATKVGTAIAQLRVSLNRSEEATLHAARVKDLSVEIFAYYRQAFGDSGALTVESAAGAVQGASGLADSVLELLEEAKGAIRDYAAMIAPLLSLTDSGKVRSTPSSEELVNAARPQKKLSDVMEITVNNVDDVASAVTDAHDVAHSVVALFGPPDPSSLITVTSTPPEFAPQPVQPVGNDGNIVLDLVIGGAMLVKAAQIGTRKLMKTIFGGKDHE